MSPVDNYSEIRTVRDLIDNGAALYGEKPFIKYRRNGEIIEKSFITLRENSLAVCRYIRSTRSERMRIAVVGKTTYEYITILTGALISGNVFAPFSPDASVEEACELFEDGDIDALFYENDYKSAAEEIAAKYGKLKVLVNMGDEARFDEIYREYDSSSRFAPLSEIELDPKECAAIIYTSGTSGTRKGVMLSSENLISNITYKELELAKDDVFLSVLPMHHIFCFSCDYFKPLLEGLTVCLNGDIGNIGENLRIFQPTTMRIVPMICETLIRKVHILHKRFPKTPNRKIAEKIFGKNIRWIAVGGAYLGPGLIDEYEKYGIILRQGYGMTETSPKITTADFGEECRDSSGRIIKSVWDVRIVDGEIQVRGKSAAMGYYKRPEETAAAFTDDGYFKTGDLGRICEKGEHLYVVGRIKNIIVLSNGENVSPEEIEKKFVDERVVKEIVVRAENDKIIAEIYPDSEYAQEAGIKDVEAYLWEKIKRENLDAKPEREISALRVREKPFPKTSTGKIKRSRTIY